MEFYDRLKYLRIKHCLTQAKLSQHLNVTERQYQRLEANTSKPNFNNLIALADFFDISLDYLVGRSDDPHRY